MGESEWEIDRARERVGGRAGVEREGVRERG